jgi:hypothetical protein
MNAKTRGQPTEAPSRTLQDDPPEGSREIIERELEWMKKQQEKTRHHPIRKPRRGNELKAGNLYRA